MLFLYDTVKATVSEKNIFHFYECVSDFTQKARFKTNVRLRCHSQSGSPYYGAVSCAKDVLTTATAVTSLETSVRRRGYRRRRYRIVLDNYKPPCRHAGPVVVVVVAVSHPTVSAVNVVTGRNRRRLVARDTVCRPADVVPHGEHLLRSRNRRFTTRQPFKYGRRVSVHRVIVSARFRSGVKSVSTVAGLDKNVFAPNQHGR